MNYGPINVSYKIEILVSEDLLFKYLYSHNFNASDLGVVRNYGRFKSR